MKQFCYLKILIFTVLVVLLTITPCFALKRVVPEATKEDVINKYLRNRTLDSVEGVWSFTVNGYYGEVAIVKTPSEVYKEWTYVGIIVNGQKSFGKIGEAKIVLNKTAIPGIYTGAYVVQANNIWAQQSLEAVNLTTTQPNVMQANVPYLGLVSFIRIDNINPTGGGVIGGTSTGTGFFITPAVVVTNYHVVANAKKIEVTFQNDYTIMAKVIGKDEANDIAVLSVEGLEKRVIPLTLGTTSTIKEGEKVYTIGFPLSNDLGTRHKISEGLVNGLTGLKDDPTVFQISIPIQPGNSGGPLISSDGRVIGITSSGLNSVYYLRKAGTVPQNVNFAVKSDYILPVLNVVGVNAERQNKINRTLDPITIMDIGKSAVVYIKSYRE
ncbi:S1C family serine protease [Sporomusa aerivorans]|uniref:S1C family serine protease n=1 Tax=Sporomusa aerivorans TaxID=204936 RepID=UPI00352A5F9E